MSFVQVRQLQKSQLGANIPKDRVRTTFCFYFRVSASVIMDEGCIVSRAV